MARPREKDGVDAIECAGAAHNDRHDMDTSTAAVRLIPSHWTDGWMECWMDVGYRHRHLADYDDATALFKQLIYHSIN